MVNYDAVRKAKTKDLASIGKWLRAEYEQEGEGFWVNWSVIQRAFGERQLFVLGPPDDIAGFICDGHYGPDILSVRSDKRRQGYGTQLAEWTIASAIRRGICTMNIQCAPSTSLKFWRTLGFEKTNEGNFDSVYASKILSPPRQLLKR